MPSIEVVADQVNLADLPVLFLDTCIPLDIIRSPIRDSRGLVPSSLRLSEAISSNAPRCVLVTPSFIHEEWDANFRNVFEGVEIHLRAIDEHATRFHDLLDALGIGASLGRASYADLGVAERLLELAQVLLTKAIRIEQDDASVLRAVERVRRRLPPSRSGAQVRDCTIVEECLAVCSQLRDAGHREQKVFCTSNVKDYCDPKRRLHANLGAEFDEVGLRFTSNLPWAPHELIRGIGTVPGESTPLENRDGGGQD